MTAVIGWFPQLDQRKGMSARLPTESIQEALAASGFCRGLGLKDIEQIAAQCQVCHALRGEFLWKSQSCSDSFALIQSGVVRLTQQTPGGKHVVVELLGPGDCTGLLATLGGTNHPFSAFALSNVDFIRIPSQAWRELSKQEPGLLLAAVEEVVPRMLGGYGFMAQMATSEVESRLALALLRMDDLNSREFGPGQPIRISRQSLADIVVTTVESAIRVTSRWQKTGIVRTKHCQIEILDRGRLQELAGFPSESSVFKSSGVLTPRTQAG
jgi:CRP-like cAMP-binding protein